MRKVCVWNMQKLWNFTQKINILIMLLTWVNIIFNPLDGESLTCEDRFFFCALSTRERGTNSKCSHVQPCYLGSSALFFLVSILSWQSRESESLLLPEFLSIFELVKRIAMLCLPTESNFSVPQAGGNYTRTKNI